MLNINVGKFGIRNFSKNDSLIDEINKSKSPFIHNVLDRLLVSREVDTLEFSNAYLVYLGDTPIGYIFLTSKNPGYAYLQYMIFECFRGKNLANDMVSSITDYILENNHDLKELRLNIDASNIKSMKVAEFCNYVSNEEVISGKIDFVIDNPYYLRKKR